MDPVSFIPDNQLKIKLANKQIVSGLFLCEIRQSSVMQMLYNGGFDFVIIDGYNLRSTISLVLVASIS